MRCSFGLRRRGRLVWGFGSSRILVLGVGGFIKIGFEDWVFAFFCNFGVFIILGFSLLSSGDLFVGVFVY